jgi:hypothetical protein
MKTRTFKNRGLQRMYDLFRYEEDNRYFYNTAAGNAYRLGREGHPDRNVPTSLAHAAWAAGADALHDANEREVYDEMDGSAAMDCSVEDLY